MNRQNRRIQRKLANLKNLHPLWVRTVAGLAAVVMFFTVYSLILPAAAATGDQATEESGFFLEESAAETEAKELAEAEPASGGEAAQEAESPSGSSEEGSAGQQKSSSGSGESSSSSQPEALQAETSGSGSGWESIPQDNTASADTTKVNTDTASSTASGSGQNGTEEFVVSEQETNKSAEAAAVTEETVSETASQETNATTEEITEETSEELSAKKEEEEEPVYTDTIETEDEKTGIKAKIVFDEEIVRDTDKLVLAAASDKKSDKKIVIPLNALEKGIVERCAEIVNKDLDDEEKKSADDIETVKAEFVGLTIEDKDGEEVSLPANTRMRVEIVFPGSYETEDEEYQCVLMAEQSAKDYQEQLEKKAADDELVVSMEKLKADVSEQDQADGGKTVVSFETKELNSAGIVVFRVSEEDVEEASSDEGEVSEESSETSSEEISDETAETLEDVTDESSDEISESKETVSEDALAEVSAENTDEVTSESEEAASEEDETVYEAGTLKADGSDYHITMSYAEDAKIPAGARLEVRELQERTREFNKLIGQYNKEFPDAKIETESSSAVVRGLKKATDAVTGFIGGLLGIEKAPEPTSVQTARLFDITILDENGKEIEPSSTVQVDIQLDALQQVAKESDVTLIHFQDKANEVDASLSGETLSFETDSFSVYGVMYTVDFGYSVNGQLYTYTMSGGGVTMLSSLAASLRIAEDIGFDSTDALMREVKSVRFSNENLIKVTQTGEDWILESLAPFDTEEELIITMKNGDVVTVKVKDASEVSPADGIKSLLTNVEITGAKQENGKYIFYPDQPYGFKLSFAEVNKNDGQFPMSGSFTYQLPTGLVPYGSSVSNYLEIDLSGGEHAGEKVKLNYTISSGGLVTFTWDTTENPEAYEQLKNALYSQFKLEMECTYNGEDGILDFGNDIKKDVEVRSNGTVNVNKTGNYNAATNCVDYSVTVYSDGITKDVQISDTVSGSALTYNGDAVSSSSVYGKEVPAPTSTANGFSMTIPQMSDQETVTVRYSAAVNLDDLHQNEDGSWGTFDETGNRVTVKSKDNPDVNTENYGKNYGNKISMSNIGKSGIPAEADETGHATVNWTIHANDNANVSMAGHTISDSISGNSVPMNYNGSGIHVTAYNADGSVAYEKDIVWGTEGLAKAGDGQSWTWSVPNQAPDTGKLSYLISYTTDVDVSGRVINTDISNHAESDNGGSSNGGTHVTPNGGGLTARKKAVRTDLTAKTVTWEVSFDVPATGLDSAIIHDVVPIYYSNGQITAVDNYLGDSTITIAPELEGDESYEVSSETDNEGKEHIVIRFKKMDDEVWVDGLTGTGSARRIRVQFQTEIDDQWRQAAIDNPNDGNALYHTNNADVTLNGQTIATSATTRIDGNEPGMSKVHGAQAQYQINGNRLPAYPYVVTLQGITDDFFDDSGMLYIEDTFNSKYLAYYPGTEYNITGDNDLVGYLYGATSFQDLSKGGDPIHNTVGHSQNRVVNSPENGKVLISISRDDIPTTDDGNYYPYYYVFYYLTVKDPIALEKLIQAIQNSESGTYQILNTVTNQKFGTDTDTAEFQIPVLDKSITSEGGKAYYNNGNWMVDFKIDVNPDALELGDDEEITLTDDYTNLAVDYTTIKIQKEVNKSLADVTDEDGVSWNRKGNRVTYTLKNGIHYVITYKARITGETAADGKVHFENTAEYFGVKKWAKGEQKIDSGGSGSSPTYGVTVFKHEKGAGSSPLSGAKFKLYKYTSTHDQEQGWENQPSNAINIDRTPVDSGWEAVREMTTGTDGVAKTSSADGIQRCTWYMLVEQEAPIYDGSEHYQLKDFGYVFWITDKGVADYSHYVYLNDDVIAIDNEPPIPERVNIGATKTWTNDNGDITRRKDITVRLFADGVPYSDWTDKNGNHLEARTDTVKILPLKEDGTTDGYTWNNLPGGPVYSVVEDEVAGYTTSYSSKGTQVSGNINIRNKYIPGKTFIHVEKKWAPGVSTEDRAEDVTIQLKRKVSANAEIRVVRNNGQLITHFSVPVGSNVIIGYDGKQGIQHEYHFENGDRPRSELYRGNGTQQEKLIDAITDSVVSDTTGHMVRYSVNGIDADGLTLRFPEDYGQTQGDYDPNLKQRFTVLPFVSVNGGTEATYTDDTNFNNELHYYTISAADNWTIDIDRLVKEDDDGKYIYYIEEVGVNDNTQTPEEAKYSVTYGNNDGIEGGSGNETDDTITVTNSPEPGSLEVTKKVSGHDAKVTYSIAVKAVNGHYYDLNGNDKGTDPFYITFGKDQKQRWNSLPAGTYTVEEADASVEGYSWSVTGTGDIEVKVGETTEAEVVNTYEEVPQTGSLQIKKTVKVDQNTPSTPEQKALVAGTYDFTVASTTLTPAVTRTISITFGSDGTITGISGEGAELSDGVVQIKDLTADVYTISENTPSNGAALIETEVTGNGSVSEYVATVIVTAGDTAEIPTAQFTNNVETTSIVVEKKWYDNNEQIVPAADKTITFTLYQLIQDSEGAVVHSEEYTKTQYSNSITGSQSVTISGLPKYGYYNGERVPFSYEVIEHLPTELIDQYTPGREQAAVTPEGYRHLVMANTPVSKFDKKTDITVEKEWRDLSGNKITNSSDRISFTVKQSSVETEYVPLRFIDQTVRLFSDPLPSTTYYVKKGSKFTVTVPISFYLYFRVNGNIVSYNGRDTQEFTINEATTISSYGWATLSSAVPNGTSGTDYYKSAEALIAANRPTQGSDSDPVYTYVLGSSDLTAPEGAPGQASFESAWKAEIADLPLYTSVDGKIYAYEVQEISILPGGDASQEETLRPTQKAGFLKETDHYYVKWENDNSGNWTITNQEKPAEFSFTKEWYDIGTEPVCWPKDSNNNDIPITVTITGKKTGADDITITKLLTSATPGADAGYSLEAADNKYKFTFTGLQNGYTYTVTEAAVAGYHTEYYLKDSSEKQASGVNWTDDGGTIRNILTTAALPSAGGTGTRLYTILGFMLTAIAGALLIWRRRLL